MCVCVCIKGSPKNDLPSGLTGIVKFTVFHTKDSRGRLFRTPETNRIRLQCTGEDLVRYISLYTSETDQSGFRHMVEESSDRGRFGVPYPKNSLSRDNSLHPLLMISCLQFTGTKFIIRKGTNIVRCEKVRRCIK